MLKLILATLAAKISFKLSIVGLNLSVLWCPQKTLNKSMIFFIGFWGSRELSKNDHFGSYSGGQVFEFTSKNNPLKGGHPSLVALYRAMRLRFGYGFESCDANGPRNVKNTNLAKHRPICFPHFSLLAVRNRSWKCLNEGNFTLRFVWQENVAIRVPKLHYRDKDGIAAKLLRCGIAS